MSAVYDESDPFQQAFMIIILPLQVLFLCLKCMLKLNALHDEFIVFVVHIMYFKVEINEFNLI